MSSYGRRRVRVLTRVAYREKKSAMAIRRRELGAIHGGAITSTTTTTVLRTVV